MRLGAITLVLALGLLLCWESPVFALAGGGGGGGAGFGGGGGGGGGGKFRIKKRKPQIYTQMVQIVDTQGVWHFGSFVYKGKDELELKKERILSALQEAYRSRLTQFKAGEGDMPLKPSYKLIGKKASKGDKEEMSALSTKLSEYVGKAYTRNEAKGLEGDNAIRVLLADFKVAGQKRIKKRKG